jgi:hypothetical protein
MRSFLLIAVLALVSCKKSALVADCENLKGGMLANDRERVKEVISHLIALLPDNRYTEANLNNLAHAFSNRCDITAEVVCFSCIQTYPEESEIRLHVSSGGAAVQKVVDISYRSDNAMVFIGMHD